MTDGPADAGREVFVRLGGRGFAYRDFGGGGPVVPALHGHFGRGRLFAPPAAALAGRRRIVALDQRGHGLSDNGGGFTPGTTRRTRRRSSTRWAWHPPPSSATRWAAPSPSTSPGGVPTSSRRSWSPT
ncbi:alpha/beta fold hydrolase [Kitasatospora sp. NPDC091335]|uniref:alpha/beta fold hydrolase n=1 Tax=Kitasatospora sp. NPDC091335 TaxID=3364085 RepID=UPI0038060DBF